MITSRFPFLCGVLIAVISVAACCSPVTRSALAALPNSTAEQINQQLRQLAGDEADMAPLADDATFLRRISFDLIGESPSPQEVTAFLLDTRSDKRARAVERLMADPHFGQNWGRYWRDVILARRLDQRADFLVGNSITVYMTEQHNRGASWMQIASDFITASGDVRQNGATGVIMAQDGKAAETAAEMARIFLGMQIQCAQCHDHPYDDWTRQQFHELAAFFPRTGVRQKANSTTRTFEVFSFDGPQRRRGGRQNATLEHYMPNLEDPTAQGTLTQPVFFLNTRAMETAATDRRRRETLADWFTDPNSNPWFAKAYVNRIWAELLGRGFHEPVDDLGANREMTAGETLDYLADEFVASGHDIKWLFRTIMATQAYQRQSRPRGQMTLHPFAASCAQPLRADQLLNALTSALGIPEPPAPTGYGRRSQNGNGLRAQFNRTFGYDPSLDRADVSASIPQTLMLMNAPQIARAIRGNKSSTMLGTLLAAEKDNRLVVDELYLRCLARQASDAEMKTCLAHVQLSTTRSIAFEDLLWALINSAEFRYRK